MEFLGELRQRITTGIVGGSDLVKAKEQLGEDGERTLLVESALGRLGDRVPRHSSTDACTVDCPLYYRLPQHWTDSILHSRRMGSPPSTWASPSACRCVVVHDGDFCPASGSAIP
jgi:hypothetical protein